MFTAIHLPLYKITIAVIHASLRLYLLLSTKKSFVMPETRGYKLVKFSVRISSLTWYECIQRYKLSIMTGESIKYQHKIYVIKILQ
jgi:hypothetical protein